ncbi:MAG: short-chain dehydrogenase [Gammaproteobacteria bacterium]|jgi:NAD(P)-dependent dehydrogenase (short-subunit alcohol dehydrogenase family)|nr:short-chain dehydrogenase [Gammaproteobacteria bacterium]|tara:strand:+ start:15078 stop:15947 length:870 start_codon:yes stop_codon:yes gene_type:complete
MQDLKGRVGVVTGGGSGIGRGIALALAREGMNVAVSDIDYAAAGAVAEEVSALGVQSLAVETDVARPESVAELADRVYSDLGAAHLLCNNAGVVTFKYAQDMKEADWDWVLNVDLYGVVHGVLEFLPRMLASGDPGHIVNTGSIAGLLPAGTPGIIAYTAAKYGVVGLTEAMKLDLADTQIGVSVVCPGGVETQIVQAGRNRQSRYGGKVTTEMIENASAPQEENTPQDENNAGELMQPGELALLIIAAVRENELYVVPHSELQPLVEQRFDRLYEAIENFMPIDPRTR